jgi:hypothetical protein
MNRRFISAIAVGLIGSVVGSPGWAKDAGVEAATETVTDPATLAASENNTFEEVWFVSEGQNLSDALGGWAQRAGWKLIWEADTDFRLGASGEFSGSFDRAASTLITAFGRSKPRLRANFYEGNKVLRVWIERAEP